jgi:hypothetical protein
MVEISETFLDIRNIKVLLVLQIWIPSWNFDALEGLLHLGEVILCAKACASAMFGPFMLNQAARGHEIHHVVHN